MGAIGRLRRSVHTFWDRLKNEGLYTAETEDTYVAATEKEAVSIRRRPILYIQLLQLVVVVLLLYFYSSTPHTHHIPIYYICVFVYVCVCDRYPIFHLLHTYNPC